jgi:hypothetical protein
VRVTQPEKNLVIVDIQDYRLAFSREFLIGVHYGNRWYVADDIHIAGNQGIVKGSHLRYLDDGTPRAIDERITQLQLEVMADDLTSGKHKALLTDLKTASELMTKEMEGLQ